MADNQEKLTWDDFKQRVTHDIGSDDPEQALAMWISLMTAPSDRQNMAARFLEALLRSERIEVMSTQDGVNLAFNMADGILEGDRREKAEGGG